jgi:hypothetical protein
MPGRRTHDHVRHLAQQMRQGFEAWLGGFLLYGAADTGANHPVGCEVASVAEWYGARLN